MKKLLLALAIGTASLVSFSSCTKEYITNYLPGYSYVYTVESSQWRPLANNPRIFELIVDVDDLDERYFEDGDVSVAALFDSNNKVYEKIPATFGDYHFSANYAVGSVAVYAEYRGQGAPVKPEKMLIKVILTDAEVGN